MTKLINDTLKKKDGTWDKQAISMFVSFFITVALGLINTFLSYYMQIYDNRMAEGVFDTFAILTGSLSGFNIGNKLVDMKKAKNPQQEGYQDYGNIDTMNKL